MNVHSRYKPGDIVIFMAGDLYHAVGEWYPERPTPEMQRAKITSGRVSHVFFFPKSAFKALDGKPKDWAMSTVWGKHPVKEGEGSLLK